LCVTLVIYKDYTEMHGQQSIKDLVTLKVLRFILWRRKEHRVVSSEVRTKH